MKDYSEAASAARSVTGRDGYITLQALIYAVGYIQTLPEDRQEHGNMLDMCALARNLGGDHIAGPLWSAEYHVGHEIELWPLHGGDEPNGHYTDEELVTRDKLRASINELKARVEEASALQDAPPSDVVTSIGDDDQKGEAA